MRSITLSDDFTMNGLAKTLYLSVFLLFIGWGMLPQDANISAFSSTVYHYAQGLAEHEYRLLGYVIVPGFIAALGWCSWDLWRLLAERLRARR
ncbi:hypothetical protein [Shewanella sp. NIFS-20-20]|uniref:hypothetical protein n=1 Tax=Shewanella sp. NIFS-20-20 TaxID=2853806 RepID=UPI001C443B2C|nr:hypothetical protein [Shewanella sp. NIFS-20-20]MBV7317467.1 hypothetical protein [Shewanella sp. NIFS-20-20]